MKYTMFLFAIFLFFACGQKKNDGTHVPEAHQDSSDTLHNTIAHVYRTYYVGDINADKHADTAYVIYDQIVRADGTIEKDCANRNCEVSIKFSGTIPDLNIDQSLSIYMQKTEDLNNDNGNEIVLYSEGFEGYWYNLYVWTLKNGKWEELARTKAMLCEEKDYENRIIYTNSQFYLVGDRWNDSMGEVSERSVKVKIKNTKTENSLP